MTVLLTYDNTNNHVGDHDKSPRYMHSHGELRDDGTLQVSTRTWTDILLGGFHGSVNAALFDVNGTCISKTNVQTFGVDGKWVGNHDRTDPWSFKFDPALAAQAKSMRFTNSWNPQWFLAAQNTMKWVGLLLQALEQALSQTGDAQMS